MTTYDDSILGTAAEFLAALDEVHDGDLDQRLGAGLKAGHPLLPLATSINALIAKLDEAQIRSARLREEMEDRLATIELQNAALRELSTPIIEVWQGVVCLPVIGLLDSRRSQHMMAELLAAVVQRRAELVIIDVTGIDVMDRHTADQFVATARAVRLLGTQCTLSGIQPSVAQALVALGFEGGLIRTASTLRDALAEHLSGKVAKKPAGRSR